MNSKNQSIVLILLLGFLSLVFFIIFNNQFTVSVEVEKDEDLGVIDSNLDITNQSEEELKNEENVITEKVDVKSITFEVPFVLQAPNGNWDNPVFQDACEEAAIIMAEGWLKDVNNIQTREAVEKINEISLLAEERYGTFVDASIKDTSNLLNEYYGEKVSRVEDGISLEDVKIEISQGNLVIVPTNGRKMQNPYYTPPGPITHMIVITGYDKDTNEFITNDSGTRMGKNFRYNENILYSAIRDYPTGNHYLNPIPEGLDQKAMMIVKK